MKLVSVLSVSARLAQRSGKPVVLAATVALMLASPLLWAHAHLIATQPEDGATLEQAPEQHRSASPSSSSWGRRERSS